MKKSKLEHNKFKDNGFRSPNGYFNSVEDAIFTRLATDKFPKKGGFIVPDNYLDNVENNVLKNITTENIQKQTGHQIPKDYFNDLEEKVIAKIKEEKSETKVINFRSIFLKRILPFAAAASLLLFLVLNNNRESISLDNIASTEIEKWIESDLITLETYEIAEVYNDVELDDQDYFADDEIIEYLDDMNVESLIIEN